MKKYSTSSAEETNELGKQIAKNFKGGVIALYGEIGSGKTTFVQGFAQGLNIKDKITSPTFVLVRQHKIPKTKAILYHIDLYRLEDLNTIKNIGLGDFLTNPQNIVLVEWAEKATSILPQNIKKITLKIKGQQVREITVT